MSPKALNARNSSPVLDGNITAADFAMSKDRAKFQRTSNTERTHQILNTSSVTQSSSIAHRDGSISNEGTTDDSEGSQSDDADLDNGEENDEDPDARAPSDIHLAAVEGQAGLYQSSVNLPKPQSGKCVEKTSNLRSKEIHTKSCDTNPSMSSSVGDVLSDDEDYNGVDLISDSGDEEPTMEHEEEKAIIESEENTGPPLLLSPLNSPSDTFSISSADLGGAGAGISPWPADDPFFAEQINLLNQSDFTYNPDYSEHANGLGPSVEVGDVPRRRVRFAEPLMLPAKAETMDSPNLNNAAPLSEHGCLNKLSETGLSLIKDDQAPCDNTFANSGKATHPTSVQHDPVPRESIDSAGNNDVENSVGSSSGYETDEGETTDEEDVPASATTRPSALLRHSSSDLNNRLAGQPLPKAPTSKLPPGHRWGPTLGSWIADPTKPIAVVASSGTQLIVYPAQRPSSRGGKVFPTIASSSQSSAQASPRTSLPLLAAPSYPTAPDESEVEKSDISNQESSTRMLGASPNLFGRHALGPPEAFFPFHSIGIDGEIVVDGPGVDDDDDDDDDDDEGLLNIEDFIDFGDESEDTDGEDRSDGKGFQSPTLAPSDFTDADPTPMASPTAPSSSHHFLDHLDKGMVTAFRRNQYGYDASGYRSSNSSSVHIPNAIKSNAFVAANTLDALKKRKLSDDIGPSAMADQAFAKRRMVSPS
ncbi:MAG: hypothetical protein Q9219_006002 [cf. Caloplaca sp. 3 TL-2023]